MGLRLAWALVLGLFLACGGDDSTTQDAAPVDSGVKHFDVVSEDVVAEVTPPPPKPDAGYPGPHSDPPQVINYGGTVLTAPNVVPIFFGSDPYQTDIESFLTQLAASTFWGAVTGEYGVGALTVSPSVVVTDTAPTTTNTGKIDQFISAYLDGTHTEFPAITPNNIYVIFYPSQTTISDTGFGTSCVNYGGYHEEGKNPSQQKFVYAVLPRCAQFGSLTGLDALTGPLSHELIEASTDPFVQSSPAWASADTDHMVWNVAPLGEVGDMCAYEPQSFSRIVGSFVVQRTWSNASAKAGHDPCVPPLAPAYYNAAPVLNDPVTIDLYGQSIPTKGVQVALGKSKTIDVQLFTDKAASDWTVQAIDSTYGTNQPKELNFQWDKTTGNNGDVLHLTITRVADGQLNGSEMYIYAYRSQSNWNMWFGFIQN
jgi:hypothetical protein